MPEKQDLRVVDIAHIESTSGHLILCDSCSITGRYAAHPLQPSSFPKNWRVGNFVQLNNEVHFTNKRGDGCYAVLSHGGKYYVETNYPTQVKSVESMVERGDFEEKHGSRILRLEGLVGVGSGAIAIVDPEQKNPSFNFGELDPNYERGEYVTILKVEKGKYQCRFSKKKNLVILERV